MPRKVGYFVYGIMILIGFLILFNSDSMGKSSARKNHTRMEYIDKVPTITYTGYPASELDHYVRNWQILGGIFIGVGLFWLIAPVGVLKRPDVDPDVDIES